MGLISLYDLKNGRITDAHNFDADWLSYFDPKSLNSLVSNRIGLMAKENRYKATAAAKNQNAIIQKTVVLYDTNRSRLEKVKNYLVEHFVLDLVYLCQVESNDMSDFILKSNHSGNLFFQEPFYDMLLSSDVLYHILRPEVSPSNKQVEIKPIIPYKLFDVSQNGMEKYYDRSHIPSAVHMVTSDLEEKAVNKIYMSVKTKSRAELAKVFMEYGIGPNNTEMIVLYGNPDPMAAYRVGILMKSMGVRDVHVLNGGFRAWLTRNFPVESGSVNKRVAFKSNTASLEQSVKLYEEQAMSAQSPINYIVDQNYVSDLVKNSELFAQEYALVDVRSFAEYMGETSGYPHVKIRGRIPSSVWGRGGSSSSQLEDYRNPDLTMRSGVEILKMWDEMGIDYRYKHLIFYCGNGWRSSEVMYYAEAMGLYRISLYDGGWLDWISNTNNPIETNDPSLKQTVQAVVSSASPSPHSQPPPPPPPSFFSTSSSSSTSTSPSRKIESSVHFTPSNQPPWSASSELTNKKESSISTSKTGFVSNTTISSSVYASSSSKSTTQSSTTTTTSSSSSSRKIYVMSTSYPTVPNKPSTRYYNHYFTISTNRTSSSNYNKNQYPTSAASQIDARSIFYLEILFLFISRLFY